MHGLTFLQMMHRGAWLGGSTLNRRERLSAPSPTWGGRNRPRKHAVVFRGSPSKLREDSTGMADAFAWRGQPTRTTGAEPLRNSSIPLPRAIGPNSPFRDGGPGPAILRPSASGCGTRLLPCGKSASQPGSGETRIIELRKLDSEPRPDTQDTPDIDRAQNVVTFPKKTVRLAVTEIFGL
jgi:hypothetical protein